MKIPQLGSGTLADVRQRSGARATENTEIGWLAYNAS